MKQKNMFEKIIFSCFCFLLFFILSCSVFAIQGSSTDGSMTSKNGGMSSVGTRGASTDGGVTARTSAAASGVASSYSDGTSGTNSNTVTGNTGPDMSLADTQTSSTSTSSDSGSSSSSSSSGGGSSSDQSVPHTSHPKASSTSSEETSTSSSTASESQPTGATTATNAETTTPASSFGTSSGLISVETQISSSSVVPLVNSDGSIVSLTVTSLSQDGLTFTLPFSENTFSLNVEESTSFDSTGDGLADVSLYLTSLTGSGEQTGAVLQITYLNVSDALQAAVSRQVANGDVSYVQENLPQAISLRTKIIIVAFLILAVLLWIIFFKKPRKSKPNIIFSRKQKDIFSK